MRQMRITLAFRRPVAAKIWLPLLWFVLVRASPAEEVGRESLLFESVTATLGDPGRSRVVPNTRILVRDGMIVAIETAESGELEIPAGTRRIDASGLHVVPAFIDSATTLGFVSTSESRNASSAPDFRKGPTPETQDALRAGITPEDSALDSLSTGDDRIEAHRRAGFAAAHVVPKSGYLAGRGAVVLLSGQPLRESVLREDTGILASFHYGHSGYPVSLMGAIAHLRQTFLDAEHHRRWKAFHARHPRERRRPPRDTSLDALAPVLDGQLPLIFYASSLNNIHRALQLAQEFQLRVVLTGGDEAYRALDALQSSSQGVILLPDYTDKPQPQNDFGAPPERVQKDRRQHWRRKVLTARSLTERGIPHGFGSGGESDPGKLLESVRVAMNEGLSASLALRSLTLGSAELLGVAELVGSIDVGKVANLSFFDAPFASENARVRYLLADGVLFEFEGKNNEEKKDSPEQKLPPESPEETEAVEKPRELAPSPEIHLLTESELKEDRRPRLQTGGDLFIRDARVLTMAGPELDRASIRIRSGKIEAVGPEVQSDGITSVIDARGWYVMPGIIDCHSHMAVDGSLNEFSESITCQVRIADVIDPDDVAIFRALAGGTTMAHVLHGSANTIGGQCCLLRMKYGRSAQEIRARDVPPTVKFALGENVKQSNFRQRSGKRFPVTRMGVEATLRRAFTVAREYEQEWVEHGARLARGKPSLEPRRDLRLEALLGVLRGEMQVHCHCYRADEIIMLLSLAEEFGFRISTLQHVLEGYKVAPEIAAHGAAASTFSDWWGYKIEAFDAIPHNASLMNRSGISVSLNSDSDELVRHLFFESAKACRYGGASEDEALRMITVEPALQLGIENRVGSIEVGKEADLAIFDAHPLSVYARCRYTIIEGEVYFEMGGERRNPMAGRPLARPEDFLPQELDRHPEDLYAIRGARIVPIEGSPIEEGTVVLSGGKIRAVGSLESVDIPPDAVVLEAKGLEVYPGLIDAGTELGLTEIDSVRGTVDLRETGDVQPDLRMAVAVNPHSELLPVARAGGVTHAAVFNRGGLISGRPALIRLEADSTPAAIVSEEIGMQVNLLRVVEDEEPGVEKTLKRWFGKAREIADRVPPNLDPRVEALLPYVKQARPVIFSAHTEREIRLALKLAEELRVRAIIRGGRDAWKVASLLADKKVPVIVGPVLSLPTHEYDPYDAPYRNPGRLQEAGVPIAFQSSRPSQSRNLSNNVGMAVAYGLPHDAGLRALTLGAAEILGVADRTGSIVPGKSGNLLITNGDPLEIRTQVKYLFIDGRPVSLESRHTRLYRQFRDRLAPRRTKGF